MKPLCIDLCCGSGGWAAGFIAEGYNVIGFDIGDQPLYPGEFYRADVKTLAGDPRWTATFARAAVIVASPPCEEFSRHQMPWTRARNPPPPDLTIAEACWTIAAQARVPIVLENVRAAQEWFGRAKWHCGSFYLWGDVPALMPAVKHRAKESYGSADRLKRARVPIDLASHIAQTYKPEATA